MLPEVLTPRDVANMSMEDYVKARRALMHADTVKYVYDKTIHFNSRSSFVWPLEVPLFASARYYEGAIHFDWYQDYGRVHKGYRLPVGWYLSGEDIERVRQFTEEQEVKIRQGGRAGTTTLSRLFPEHAKPKRPEIECCPGCGLDYFTEGGATACVYCTELQAIRAARTPEPKKRRWFW